MLKLATEQDIPYWTTEGTMMRGWALAEQGQEAEGLALLRQGFAAWRAMGTTVVAPYFLAWQIEMYLRIGQLKDGQQALTEAFTLSENTGERFYAAELYRLKGELVRAQSIDQQRESEAEACFLQANEIARQQHAKSLELRASTSLARLWQQQGKTTAAHQLLSEVYNWFTEGFDTKDLQEAKALLEELAGVQ